MNPQTPDTPTSAPNQDSQKALEMIVPINRSKWAIIAGYVALFNFPFVITAPFAILFAILGLREIAKKPGLKGKGRCWFAIIYSIVVMGGLALIIATT